MRHRHTRARTTAKVTLLNTVDLMRRWKCSREQVRARLVTNTIQFHENSAGIIVELGDLKRAGL